MAATQSLITLLGSVALLIWGMRMVRTGMSRAYGAELRRLIGHSVSNRVKAFFAGVGVTAVLQSSTATGLMVAAFTAKGFVDVAPALAVMLGADVGTTLVAQLLSLNVSWLSPVLLLVGVATFTKAGSSRTRDAARACIGLGLMLMSLKTIVALSIPMRESPQLLGVIAALDGEPLLAVLLAALLTWLAHSSLAVVLMVMSLASSGAISPTFSLSLVLGANLGATLPAIMATLQSGVHARRVTIGNAIFKASGALVALPLLGVVAPLLAMIESDPSRLVVNFHTAFNLAVALAFLPLVGVVARLCERLLPTPAAESDSAEPLHLDPTVVTDGSLALSCATRETLRLADIVKEMLREVGQLLESDDRERIQELGRYDDTIDRLYSAIKLYVTEISRHAGSPEQQARSREILSYATHLEHVGDVVDKSLRNLLAKKVRKQLRFSHEGQEDLLTLYGRVVDGLQLSAAVFISGEREMARKLLLDKSNLRELERTLVTRHLDRLRSCVPETLATSDLHLDIARDLKRIHSHLAAVAYPILDAGGELTQSRLKVVEGGGSLPTAS